MLAGERVWNDADCAGGTGVDFESVHDDDDVD